MDIPAAEPSAETRFLHAIEMGLGAWQWGDRLVWQYGLAYSDKDVFEAFKTSLERGIRFVDTAEVYGSGRSERMLGEFVKRSEQPVLVATKFFPFPWRFFKDAPVRALKASLARLSTESVDLYQVHWPSPLISVERIMEGMAACVKEGLTRTVGVSNFDQSQMMMAYSTLARHGISLASNQVHYSLLNRTIEKNGMLDRCKELGVRLIAYSPLEMGLLTGKYSVQNPPKGARGAQYITLLQRIPSLLKVMTEIGQNYGGKSNAEVALNWCINKGTLVIPGAKNAAQALQNAGGAGWKLKEEDMARLDQASDLALGYK